MDPERTRRNTAAEREFFDAIRHRRFDEIQERVASDPDLLLAFDDASFGATPLTLAAFREDRELVDVLLDLKADPERASDWKPGPWTPLHCALFNGDSELAEHLLSRGATLDVHSAAGLNRIDDLRRLLDESPDRVSALGGDGCQPLHFAGSSEVAEILLEYGADIDARDIDHNSTPAQYLTGPRPDVVRYLFSRGAEADIFSAVLVDDASVVRTLTASNPSVVDERINQQRFPPPPGIDAHNILTFTVGENATPLQAATKGNNAKMIDLLISLGADVNGRGGYDDATALHIAAWEDNAEAAAQLLQHKADINARSGEIHNNSPAGWAIVAGSSQVFQLLMDNGAEQSDWFLRDAKAAVAGEFLQYKCVPVENYNRILARLQPTEDNTTNTPP